MVEPGPPGPESRRLEARREGRHDDAAAEEWLFACWTGRDDPAGAVGVVSGYRVLAGRPGGARTAWYWAAVARPGRPLLHVTDWAIPPRADPLLVKSAGLWAEHVCVAPMEQWTVGNEAYAAALDDPDEALGRAYGRPTAIALDLEWYAVAAPAPVAERHAEGYWQAGVGHAVIEIAGAARVDLAEAASWRWHRWGDALDPRHPPLAYAHTGVRAPFAFPDGTTADWVLTPDGWRARPQSGTHPGPGEMSAGEEL